MCRRFTVFTILPRKLVLVYTSALQGRGSGIGAIKVKRVWLARTRKCAEGEVVVGRSSPLDVETYTYGPISKTMDKDSGNVGLGFQGRVFQGSRPRTVRAGFPERDLKMVDYTNVYTDRSLSLSCYTFKVVCTVRAKNTKVCLASRWNR